MVALFRLLPITNLFTFSLFFCGDDGGGDLVAAARLGGAAAGQAPQQGDGNPPEEAAVGDLVRRAAERDVRAFGQLYDYFLERLYRYVYYRVGNPVEAEDLVEEIFLKVWEGLPGYRARGVPFAAWLFRLARNHLVDHSRTKREAGPLPETIAATDDPLDVVMRRVDAEAVRAVLGRLTEEQREVIALRFVEGLSTREIAATVGRQEGAVRALQMRALHSLRRAIGGEWR